MNLTQDQDIYYSQFLNLTEYTVDEVIAKLEAGFFWNGYYKQHCYFLPHENYGSNNKIWVFTRHQIAGTSSGWIHYEFPYPDCSRKIHVTDLDHVINKNRNKNPGGWQIIEYNTMDEAKRGFLNYMISDCITFDQSYNKIVKV